LRFRPLPSVFVLEKAGDYPANACKSDERVCKGRPRSFYPLQTRSSDLFCAAARQAAWQFQGRDVAAKTEHFRTGKRNTRLAKAGRGGRFFQESPQAFLLFFSLGGGREREIRSGSEEGGNGTRKRKISL